MWHLLIGCWNLCILSLSCCQFRATAKTDLFICSRKIEHIPSVIAVKTEQESRVGWWACFIFGYRWGHDHDRLISGGQRCDVDVPLLSSIKEVSGSYHARFWDKIQPPHCEKGDTLKPSPIKKKKKKKVKRFKISRVSVLSFIPCLSLEHLWDFFFFF